MAKLKKYLRPGERILWEDVPGEFSLLEGKEQGRILAKWVLAAGIVAAFLVFDFMNNKFGTAPKAFVVLVGVVSMLTPVTAYRALKKQAYYLTDQRAILLEEDGSISFMDYDKIDRAGCINGSGIAFGSIVLRNAARDLRWQACHPRADSGETNTGGAVLGMAFYRPRDLPKMVQLLRENGVDLT